MKIQIIVLAASISMVSASVNATESTAFQPEYFQETEDSIDQLDLDNYADYLGIIDAFKKAASGLKGLFTNKKSKDSKSKNKCDDIKKEVLEYILSEMNQNKDDRDEVIAHFVRLGVAKADVTRQVDCALAYYKQKYQE